MTKIHGKTDIVRLAWATRFGTLSFRQMMRMNSAFCWQLCLCRSDEARRLLLGVSR